MKLEQREINLFNSPYAAPRLLVPPFIKTFENYDKILQNSSIKFSKNSSYLCYCTFYKLWTGRKFKQFIFGHYHNQPLTDWRSEIPTYPDLMIVC